MNQRERTNDDPPVPPAAAPGGSPGADLNAIRDAGSAMLAAADEAINRVLSGDSAAFNTAVRQEGGQ